MANGFTRICIASVIVLLAACAGTPRDSDSDVPISGNSAVLALLDQAHADSAAGRPAAAVATVERALRIEPRNARLWLELAKIRLAQGDPDQAESLAKRASELAGSDRPVRAAGWRVIAEARRARGDVAGAEQADLRVRELEHSP
jgi:predicted Zn-dependent protease